MRRLTEQRGATLVEAALVSLVLFMFIFGIIEFGRIYNMYQVVTDAAREGARFAVAPCPTNGSCSVAIDGTTHLPVQSEIKTVVQKYLTSDNITVNPDTDIVISQVTQTVVNDSTTFTQVQVTAHYSFIVFPFGRIPITATAEMRNETN